MPLLSLRTGDSTSKWFGQRLAPPSGSMLLHPSGYRFAAQPPSGSTESRMGTDGMLDFKNEHPNRLPTFLPLGSKEKTPRLGLKAVGPHRHG